MIPLCIWGIVSALLIHLIAIRSLFIAGGEARLRLAVLAFAGGVILLQRLIRTQGEEYARIYIYGIGLAMTLFAAHNALVYELPVHPMLVFAVNVTLFGTLWWVVHKITAACSADSEGVVAASSESGSLAGFQLRGLKRWIGKGGGDRGASSKAGGEKGWEQKLPASHPGRVLLYFSLFAIPAFGFGVYLFGEDDPHRSRLGLLLFLYLWCALALLFLSSLSQLSNYFNMRGVDLPESVGLTWLSLGFAMVTVVLIAAFFLPQPATSSSLYVRERIEASYRGWEASRGFREVSPGGSPTAGRADGGGGAADSSAQSLARGSGGGETGEGGGDDRSGGDRRDRFETQREADASTRADAVGDRPRGRPRESRARGEAGGLDRFFDGLFTATIWIGVGAGIIVAVVLVLAILRALAGGLAEWRFRRKQRKAKQAAAKPKKARGIAGARFRRFHDPFGEPSRSGGGDELVRYLWEATLAWCADAGAPCEPGQTPTEFLAREPSPLAGFEDQARFLAGLLNFSEFSGKPLPESVRPKLQEYWRALQRHVASAA